MNQIRYMISDASRLVEVESHVLRYWEEELDLPIARNEMGHRYYTEDDIRMLKHIKLLKERGYQLKAIKMDISENGELIPAEEALPEMVKKNGSTQQTANEEKMQQFQVLLSKALGQALQENQETLGKNLGGQIADQISKEMNYQLRLHEEQQEEHMKKLDESIRAVLKRKEKIKKEKIRKTEKKKKFIFGKKTKLSGETAEAT